MEKDILIFKFKTIMREEVIMDKRNELLKQICEGVVAIDDRVNVLCARVCIDDEVKDSNIRFESIE